MCVWVWLPDWQHWLPSNKIWVGRGKHIKELSNSLALPYKRRHRCQSQFSVWARTHPVDCVAICPSWANDYERRPWRLRVESSAASTSAAAAGGAASSAALLLLQLYLLCFRCAACCCCAALLGRCFTLAAVLCFFSRIIYLNFL